jgi:hypothetical protein
MVVSIFCISYKLELEFKFLLIIFSDVSLSVALILFFLWVMHYLFQMFKNIICFFLLKSCTHYVVNPRYCLMDPFKQFSCICYML